jgi:DNA-binding HxlR family transcriptional regulator
MVQRDSSAGERGEAQDGRFPPVASMVESIVGCKWSVRLLQLCAEGHRRPSAFLRACSGLSAKVMNERLRKMIRFGILERTVFGDKPPVEVEYRLTPFGDRFMGILDAVRRLQEAVDHGVVAFDESLSARPRLPWQGERAVHPTQGGAVREPTAKRRANRI